LNPAVNRAILLINLESWLASALGTGSSGLIGERIGLMRQIY